MRHRTVRYRSARAANATPRAHAKTHHFLTPNTLLVLLLIAGTVALYSPILSHDFVNIDDEDYVVNNPHVTAGLNWQTIRWSLTSTEQANWHPITWLSHATDCQFFGLDAGYHHLTSLVFHVLNVILLFLVLERATGSLWRSLVVAALFAWHPFNVQSVAWVAERKNLLSMLFFLVTLGTYCWYARKPRFSRYAAVMAAFALALASKPMAVTTPFVLLLLDYWPLRRAASSTFAQPPQLPQQSLRRLVLEKLPLLAMSAASSVITVWAQKTGGALRPLQAFPLGVRLGNAVVSYVSYMWKALWPFGLAVFYPHLGASLKFWPQALAASILCAVSAVVWVQRIPRPYLLVGWLWFVGTLVPVIGIVQVGDQAMADHYAYVPLIGLFIVVVWGATEYLERRHIGQALRWSFVLAGLAILSFLTYRQVGYWQDGVTVLSHAFQVTSGNLQVEKQLANAMVRQGDIEGAVPHLLNIAQKDPQDATNLINLGSYYASAGRARDAMRQFEAVIRLTDHLAPNQRNQQFRSYALLSLGFAYITLGDFPRALTNFEAANKSDPITVNRTIQTVGQSLTSAPSEAGALKLSLLLKTKSEDKEASSLLQDAIEANPDYKDARALLNYLNGESK